MAALLIRESKIDACPPPFGAVGSYSPASGTMVRKEMREFMTECAVDLGLTEFLQPRIEHHQGLCWICVPCGAAHPRIPAHLDPAGKVAVAGSGQQLPRSFLERRTGGRWGQRGWLLKDGPELREEVELLAVHRDSG